MLKREFRKVHRSSWLARGLALGMLIGCLVSDVSVAVDSDPLDLDLDLENITRVVMVGATLGEDWAGFPSVIAADYTATSSYDKLDVTLPLYVTWISDTDLTGEPVAVSPPEPIQAYDWFEYDEFELSIATDALDGEYTACAAGDYLEAPLPLSLPLTSSGYLHLEDVHGGTGMPTVLYLSQVDDSELFVILVGWSRPGVRFDDSIQDEVEVAPGDTWARLVTIDFGPEVLVDLHVVEWVSTDFGNTSRRAVDASDLSHFVSYYGQGGVPVRWGWDSESPPNSPNFKANVSPFGGSAAYLDFADLLHMYADLSKTCGLSKAGDGDDPMVIMRWFGFEPTEETVVWGPNGETGVMFVLADREQMARGIADPYGYRAQPAATTVVPWGKVKGVYR